MRKPAHRCGQLGEGLGHLERNHKQGYCEGEYRIAQAFNARDFVTAPTEVSWLAQLFLDQFFSQHVLLRCDFDSSNSIGA